MKKLLIAINDACLAATLARGLPQYDVTVCHDGAAALAQIDGLRPEVLVIDLSLPVVDGLTVIRNCRCKPPVILALTTLATKDVLDAAADAGVQEMIMLPCRSSYVLSRLEALTQKVPSPET